MIAVVVAIFALGALVVLIWRGVHEPRRPTPPAPADPERVSPEWLDEEKRRRGDD